MPLLTHRYLFAPTVFFLWCHDQPITVDIKKSLLSPGGKSVLVHRGRIYSEEDWKQTTNLYKKARGDNSAMPRSEGCRGHYMCREGRAQAGDAVVGLVSPDGAAAMLYPFLGLLFPDLAEAAVDQLLEVMARPVKATEEALKALASAAQLLKAEDLTTQLMTTLTGTMQVVSEKLLVPCLKAAAKHYDAAVNVRFSLISLSITFEIGPIITCLFVCFLV